LSGCGQGASIKGSILAVTQPDHLLVRPFWAGFG
jgi:hypothetical protein